MERLIYMYSTISNDFEIVAMKKVQVLFCLQAMAMAKHGRMNCKICLWLENVLGL